MFVKLGPKMGKFTMRQVVPLYWLFTIKEKMIEMSKNLAGKANI